MSSTCAVCRPTLLDIRITGVIAARASSIVADTLVVVATWVRIWPMRAQIVKRKLTGVMFTDGQWGEPLRRSRALSGYLNADRFLPLQAVYTSCELRDTYGDFRRHRLTKAHSVLLGANAVALALIQDLEVTICPIPLRFKSHMMCCADQVSCLA